MVEAARKADWMDGLGGNVFTMRDCEVQFIAILAGNRADHLLEGATYFKHQMIPIMTRRFEIVLGYAFFGLGFGVLAIALASAVAADTLLGEHFSAWIIAGTFGLAAVGAAIGFAVARNIPAQQLAKARYTGTRTLLYVLGPMLVVALVAIIIGFPPQ